MDRDQVAGRPPRHPRCACILLAADTFMHPYYAVTCKHLITPNRSPCRLLRCLGAHLAPLSRCRCPLHRSSVGSERFRRSLLCFVVKACAS